MASKPIVIYVPDWGIRPFAALVKREFLSQIRSTRSSIFLVLCVAAGCITVLMAWPQEERVLTVGSQFSQMIIQRVAYLLLAACAVIVPGLAATAIVIEREQETLDQLQTTLIRPSGILLAKLVNAVGFFLLLVIALVPVVSTALFLVGVDWYNLVVVMLIVFSTVVVCAMAGICASAFCQRPLNALIFSYAGMLGAWIGGYILGVPFNVLVYAFAGKRGGGFVSAAPLEAITDAVVKGSPASAISLALYQLTLSYILFIIARNFLVDAPKPSKMIGAKPIDDPSLLRMRRTTWPFYLIDPLARKKPVDDHRNPMMVRELRWGVGNRGTFLLRVYFFSFMVWFVTSWPFVMNLARNNTQGIEIWFALQMVVVTILAPIFVANTISKEYELNNMDMLRMTLMTPRQILFGKWFAGLTMVAPLVLSAMTAWLSFFVMGAHAWSLCITGYTTLFLCAFMSVSFALLASVLAKRTVVAIVASGLLNALVFYGEYVLLRIAGAAEGFPWPQTYSPLVYFYLTKGAEGFSFNGFLNRALYLAMSLFAIMIAIRIFENRRLRDT